MKQTKGMLALVAAGMLAAGIAQAGDMDGAATHSGVAHAIGEFDRVGLSQPLPKAQAESSTKVRKPVAPTSAQERQLAARKAEFVRRLFWLAVASR